MRDQFKRSMITEEGGVTFVTAAFTIIGCCIGILLCIHLYIYFVTSLGLKQAVLVAKKTAEERETMVAWWAPIPERNGATLTSIQSARQRVSDALTDNLGPAAIADTDLVNFTYTDGQTLPILVLAPGERATDEFGTTFNHPTYPTTSLQAYDNGATLARNSHPLHVEARMKTSKGLALLTPFGLDVKPVVSAAAYLPDAWSELSDLSEVSTTASAVGTGFTMKGGGYMIPAPPAMAPLWIPDYPESSVVRTSGAAGYGKREAWCPYCQKLVTDSNGQNACVVDDTVCLDDARFMMRFARPRTAQEQEVRCDIPARVRFRWYGQNPPPEVSDPCLCCAPLNTLWIPTTAGGPPGGGGGGGSGGSGAGGGGLGGGPDGGESLPGVNGSAQISELGVIEKIMPGDSSTSLGGGLWLPIYGVAPGPMVTEIRGKTDGPDPVALMHPQDIEIINTTTVPKSDIGSVRLESLDPATLSTTLQNPLIANHAISPTNPMYTVTPMGISGLTTSLSSIYVNGASATTP